MADIFLELVRAQFYRIPAIRMEEIPADKAQLLARIGSYESSGRTVAWMRSLGAGAYYRGVRDAERGHTIHLVSDRNRGDADVRLGLRLMALMSRGSPDSHPITWYWWDQPWPRLLPADVLPEQQHLNGGWTGGDNQVAVHVYRREEAHKVLIHECIHVLRLDVPADPLLDQQRLAIERSLGGGATALYPHLGEAFTELYAELIWSAVGRTSAAAAWGLQKRCAARQAAAIYARILQSQSQPYRENTSVFAYYILKWVLMRHTDEVLLAPAASVSHWASWWIEAEPELRRMATSARVRKTRHRPMRMGMTCGCS